MLLRCETRLLSSNFPARIISNVGDFFVLGKDMNYNNLKICFLLLLICSTFVGGQNRKWRTGIYQGLIVGKSKRADVLRIFGKPHSKDYLEATEDGLAYDYPVYMYKDVFGFEGTTNIVIYRGKVERIFLNPPYEKPILREKAVKMYGKDFIERANGLRLCPTANELRNYHPENHRRYPYALVYPDRGLVINIWENDRVTDIAFLKKCP